jgi:cytochrome c
MSSFELNKVVGAILCVGLVAMVIGMIGDKLVEPRAYSPSEMKIAEAAATAETPEVKLEPISPLLASASVEKGKAQSAKCKACHDLAASRKNKIGPPLWNIVMGEKAKADGFGYSNALKAAGGRWDYEALNGFLENPKKYLKGTKMAFAGIKKAKDRADLIAFLRSLSETPKPLP